MVKGPGPGKGGGGGKTGGSGGGGRQVTGRGGKRPFYIALGILLVLGIAALSYMASRPKQTVSQIDSTIAPVPNQGHVIGSDSAALEVVEFADFECPACGSFATLTEPDVRSRLVNTGVIRYRFMDLPLTMHQNTWPAHRAAWCAGEQGKFWEMHDALFYNQDRWNGEATNRPDRVIADLAKTVPGIKIDQFNSCVSSRRFDPQIRANVNEAIRLMVQSTPTFIIGTRKVTTAVSYDVFKRHVDEVLAQSRPATKAPATKAPVTKGQTKTLPTKTR
jgi:protein-disulfide isomerase